MRFDLLSLKLFVTVCEQQSISRAAEIECIAASALSKRISDLEGTVKTPLFLRNQKGLDPTPAARDLLKHARIVLRDVGQLENEMLDHANGSRGDVRLHTCHAPLVQHLSGDLATFLAQNPAIRVSVDEGLSRNVVQAVWENAADIGIYGGETATGSLHVTPYRADRLMVIMPACHPLAGSETVRFADMAEHDIVGPQGGSCLDHLMSRAAATLGRRLRMRVRVDGTGPTRAMVEAGLGLALVPEPCASQQATPGSLAMAVLEEPWALRHWSICSREPKTLPAPVRSLLEALCHRKPVRKLAAPYSQPPAGRPAFRALVDLETLVPVG